MTNKYSIKLSPRNPNKLQNLRVYLCGCMDRVPDGGVGWRRMIANYLTNKNVTVLDPSNKPIDIGIEDLENREVRKKWKSDGDFDKVAESMKIIRNTDLRMVDLSDFLIVNLDLDHHPCGTYEELFLANRQKKPIILRVEQGKDNIPDWLLGTIPHEMMFSSWASVKKYLDFIDGGGTPGSRWMFFNL